MGTAGAAFRRGARKDTEGGAGTPPSTPAAKGGGGGKSRGRNFADKYIENIAYGDKKLAEEIGIIGAARNAEQAGGFGALTYGDDKSYYPVTRPKEEFADSVKRISENTGLSPEEVVSQLGGDEQAAALMANNQRVASSHHMGIMGSAKRALGTAGSHLIGEDEALQAKSLAALGIDKAMLAKRYGADVGMPEWLPRMQNLSPVQTGMAYGLAAAGAGAGAIALANHLAAKGQQQQSPVDYAAAVQALNAYA